MIYLFLFLLSLTLTYLIKNYAIKKSLFAIPNTRSSHTVPTPHGGGIAIAISWFTGLLYLYAYDKIDHHLFYALFFGTFVSIVSYLDDLFELSARIRLFTQSITALFGIIMLGGLERIDLGIYIIENQLITNFFAFFLIVWFINLYNFLDGIDGYAGSEALFLSLAGFMLFNDDHFIALAGAVSGFLVWNWERARIFMGDVGSTLLGYNMAIFTLYYTNHTGSNFWIWITLFGIFWFDATLTLYRRYKNGEKLSQAHRKHAYQRIVQAGWSHQKTVLSSMIINSLILIPLFWLQSWMLMPYCLAYIFGLYTIVLLIDKTKPFS